jgi:uncharacterized protein (DUF58 family)
MQSSTTLQKRLKALAEYDFSPEFSKKFRAGVMSPLGVLLMAAAVSALVGLALHPRVFALAGGLLAVAVAGVCWPWMTMRGVRASLQFDRSRVVEGEEVGSTAIVANHLPWPAWGLFISDEQVSLPTIGGRKQSRCRWSFTPTLRGEYPIQLPMLATGFPFGLYDAKRQLTVVNKLLVWPRTYPVGPVPVSDGADVVEGNVTRNKVGSTGDVLGVRPYRRGDSPRRIHWAQSAKHDRLVVCELQSNSRPVVMLVLDANEAIHTPGADGSREWAIRVAASFAKAWLEAGAQVGAMWGDVVLQPRAGAEHLQRILDGLARLGSCDKPLSQLLASTKLDPITRRQLTGTIRGDDHRHGVRVELGAC